MFKKWSVTVTFLSVCEARFRKAYNIRWSKVLESSSLRTWAPKMLFRTGNHLVQQNELSQSNTRLSNYKPSMALAKVIASMEPAIRTCPPDAKSNRRNSRVLLSVCILRHNVWIALKSVNESPRTHSRTHKRCVCASAGHVFSSPNCSEVTRHTAGGWWSKQWADLIRTQQKRRLEPRRWWGATRPRGLFSPRAHNAPLGE